MREYKRIRIKEKQNVRIIDDEKWKKKDYVYLSNVLINASYRLTVLEYHILFYILAAIQKTDIEFPLLRIHKKSLLEKLRITKSFGYTSILIAVENMMKKPLALLEDNRVKKRPWIEGVNQLVRKIGWFEVRFTCDLSKYLLNLDRGNATKIYLKQIWSLKNRHSIRIYMWLMQFQGYGLDHKCLQRKTAFERFRIMLGLRSYAVDRNPIKSMYAIYSNFRKVVLDSAIKEINDKSDIYVFYETKTTGRTVSHLIFNFGKKHIKDHSFSDLDDFKSVVMSLKGK